jgi:chemotaxis receptor (MCP) glutamine deamidase CheD
MSDSVARKIYLYPGMLAASAEPAEITTILGSCVAVALHDPLSRVGGLNHYLLPRAAPGEEGSLRYGSVAIPELIREVVGWGADHSRLEARVYGGGDVLGDLSLGNAIGAKNADFARDFLERAGIPVVESDVGGTRGRRLVFYTDSGKCVCSLHAQAASGSAARERPALVEPLPRSPAPTRSTKAEAVLVAGSSGSFSSLRAFLDGFPRSGPPVVIANSSVAPVLGSFVLSLSAQARGRVRPISAAGPLENGAFYFVGPGAHAEVELRAGKIFLRPRSGAPVHGHLPSGDVLFASGALALGPSAVGVLLGGCGEDGVDGLSKIRASGGRSFVEDPRYAGACYAPRRALALGVADGVLPVEHMVGAIFFASDGLKRGRAA